MSRYRRFIDTNVHDEAIRRLHHVYDVFDDVVVAFSGGKDSLAVLHLTRQVAAERGIGKVKAAFMDEEVIPFQVVDFITRLRDEPWLDLEWFAIPLQSHKYVLGEMQDYVQWDPAREWIRPKPEWATTETDLGLPEGAVTDQYQMDVHTIRNCKGRVAVLTGVRAAESMTRLAGSVAKMNENYIFKAPSTKRAARVWPLYDWQENDIFRLFYDLKVPYCDVYDARSWAGMEMRVSSALTSEQARRNWTKYREFAPDLYERMIEVFPEMLAHERLFEEMDQKRDLARYAQSWGTIREWIEDNITDPNARKKAVKVFENARAQAAIEPSRFPLEHVLRTLIRSGGKRIIQPVWTDEAKAAHKARETEEWNARHA